MAYKTFVNGFPLNASEINNNLMNQSIATFVDASARTTAISAPVEGQVTYLESDETFYKFNGSAWVQLNLEAPRSHNYIINGAFDVWQRGTSFSATNTGVYFADRWKAGFHNATPTTASVTQQTFSPAALNVPGFGENSFFIRSTLTSIGSTTLYRPFQQNIEDVRTLAGQNVTLSFWAKSDSARTQSVNIVQNFGSGGSSETPANGLNGVDIGGAGFTFSTTTSWQRFSFGFQPATIAGKTIGGSSYLYAFIQQAAADGSVLDIWGVQLEAGSVATPFKRNANSLQGELAACQRYYYRLTGETGSAYRMQGTGWAASTTVANIYVPLPVQMRVTPTSVEYGNLELGDNVNPASAVTSLTFAGSQNSNTIVALSAGVASGLTQYRPYGLRNSNNIAGYLGFPAEL